MQALSDPAETYEEFLARTAFPKPFRIRETSEEREQLLRERMAYFEEERRRRERARAAPARAFIKRMACGG